jgi:DNA-binding NarL/FixJ family response regulator
MLGKLRIVVADDHNLMRSGLVSILKDMEDVEVVGEAANGRQALRLVKELQPDLVLLDITMPELNGLDAAEHIKQSAAKAKVIILSMHSNEEFVAQALKAGACGYLLKEAATDELELAVKVVARGQFYLSPSISRQVVDSYLHGAPADVDLLSPRQREILQLIAEGKRTREIAEILHLSVKTIESHRSQIMERLKIHDVAGLIRFALRKGLISQ